MPKRAHGGLVQPSGFHIVCIVEGEGEMSAARTLLQRGAKHLKVGMGVRVTPVLGSRGAFEKQREVEKLVRSAAIRLQRPGGILMLFDSDGACPAMLSQRVRGWARGAAGSVPIGLVIAHHEYEAWLLAGANGLRGVAGLRRGLRAQTNPEAIEKAKERLSSFLPAGESYSPTRHQEILTACFDLEEARKRAPSFDKCLRELRAIVTAEQKDEKSR